MKKLLLVFGTRPEAIKMCPVIAELRKRPGCRVVVCVTGQHREMLSQVLSAFHIEPEYDLNVMTAEQTLYDLTERVIEGIRKVLQKEEPDLVLVHGDTTTAFAAALSCFYMQIDVGHVEAGLRTYNIAAPYPEEFNRQAVDSLSTFWFAPTEVAKRNLMREGKAEAGIFVTGNTVIDALRTTVKDTYRHSELEWASDSRLLLITAHRRENLGEPMRAMFRAIRRVIDEFPDVKAIYPVHLNPKVRIAAKELLAGYGRVHLIEPLDVIDFHNFMARSFLILTDSGGIQEEAPTLGKPVLVMRDTTERPEGVEAGTLQLVGTEEERIYLACKELLTDSEKYEAMSRAVNPYGDGRASERIADAIL